MSQQQTKFLYHFKPWRCFVFQHSVCATHHLHSMIVDELLRSDAVDLIHKALLVREEVVEFVSQPSAEGDAAFVTLIQILHH